MEAIGSIARTFYSRSADSVRSPPPNRQRLSFGATTPSRGIRTGSNLTDPDHTGISSIHASAAGGNPGSR